MSRFILFTYNILYMLHRLNLPLIPEVLNVLLIRIPFSCQIGVGARLGRGITLGHGGLGVVIHKRAEIEDGVVIATGVTIGGTSGKAGVPKIGAGTRIGTGAKILGPVTIGKNCLIGANAVVLKDVPDNHRAVGIPAQNQPL